MNTWFKAPETGLYRFMIACDGGCHLKMNTDTPYDAANPSLEQPAVKLIASTGWKTWWRNYENP